jgi:hypothetical protein
MKSGPRFCIPVNQRDALGMPREGEGESSVLFLQVWDAVNGEELWSGNKQLRSGPEVDGRRDPKGLFTEVPRR